MTTIRGVVLRSARRHSIILTPDGEYVRVGRGHLPVGAEVFVPTQGRFLSKTALAACAVVLLAFCLAQIPAAVAPAAYVTLDINPGLILSLNANGVVIDGEGLNADGDALLCQADPRGLELQTAIRLLITESFAGGYLSPERDNVILLSFASDDRFPISGDEVRAAVADLITTLELDAYLVVSAVPHHEAGKAKRDRVSVNAIVLSRIMDEKGVLPGDMTASEVSGLLKDIPPGRLFSELDFVPGRADKKGPKGPPPAHAPGAPDKDAPGQETPGPGRQDGQQEQGQQDTDQKDQSKQVPGPPDGRGPDDSRVQGPPGGEPPGRSRGPGQP